MPHSNGSNNHKQRLQQQVEAKRGEIVNTVDEIRYTLTEEIRDRKAAAREAMDWRYYVRKQPVACVGGAAVLGMIAGKMIVSRITEHSHEPDWRERIDNYSHVAGRKVDEWTGRAQGEPKWKARSRSMFASGGDLLMRELAKTAQRMILPTVIAAVTGKLSSGGEKKTVIEKNVHKAPGQPDREHTTRVREYDDDGNLKKESS